MFTSTRTERILRAAALLVLSTTVGCTTGDASEVSSTAAALTHSAAASPTRCTGKSGTRGDHDIQVDVGGMMRESRLHVPFAYRSTRGTMLVLSFHGHHETPLLQEVTTGMDLTSELHDFIVAYPKGTGHDALNLSWNAGDCCGDAAAAHVDDVAFARALIDAIASDYCIDPARVYVTGMSNGGFMAHRLGCELADRVAAIAPVAGELAFPPCAPPRPVPVLDFHGTADPVVLFDGGVGVLGGPPRPPVIDSINRWRALDGCADASTVSYQHGDTTCTRWAQCSPGAEIVFCVSQGAGHTWPGGVPTFLFGRTSDDISANEAMTAFFERYPMP